MDRTDTLTNSDLPKTVRANGVTLALGVPNETARHGALEVQLRDDLGLSLDPRVHAKRQCTTCHGRGVFVLSRRMAPEELEKLTAADPASAAQVVAANNWFRAQSVCGCVESRYKRARATVLDMGIVPTQIESASETPAMQIESASETPATQIESASETPATQIESASETPGV